MRRWKFNARLPEQAGLTAVRERQLFGSLAMTPVFVTKILSLAAAVTLVTLCVLVAVPKNAGGKLGPQPHPAALR